MRIRPLRIDYHADAGILIEQDHERSIGRHHGVDRHHDGVGETVGSNDRVSVMWVSDATPACEGTALSRTEMSDEEEENYGHCPVTPKVDTVDEEIPSRNDKVDGSVVDHEEGRGRPWTDNHRVDTPSQLQNDQILPKVAHMPDDDLVLSERQRKRKRIDVYKASALQMVEKRSEIHMRGDLLIVDGKQLEPTNNCLCLTLDDESAAAADDDGYDDGNDRESHDAHSKSRFIAPFRTHPVLFKWDGGVPSRRSQNVVNDLLFKINKAVELKETIYSSAWLLHVLSSIRRITQRKRLMDEPCNDPFLKTTVLLEERKDPAAHNWRLSAIQTDLWDISLPSKWHPPSSISGVTLQRRTGTIYPAKFGSMGENLLSHCQKNDVTVDGGWEMFGFLSSHTTVARASKTDIIFLESVLRSGLNDDAEVMRPGYNDTTADRLNQISSFLRLKFQNRQIKADLSSWQKVEDRPNNLHLLKGGFSHDRFPTSDDAIMSHEFEPIVDPECPSLEVDLAPIPRGATNAPESESRVGSMCAGPLLDLSPIPRGGKTDEIMVDSSQVQRHHKSIVQTMITSSYDPFKTQQQPGSALFLSQNRSMSGKNESNDVVRSSHGVEQEGCTNQRSHDIQLGNNEGIQVHGCASKPQNESRTSYTSVTVVRGEDEGLEYDPEYFDVPCMSEAGSDASGVEETAVVQHEEKRGSTQTSLFEVPGSSKMPTDDLSQPPEKSILERFGLWVGDGTSRAQRSYVSSSNDAFQQSFRKRLKADKERTANTQTEFASETKVIDRMEVNHEEDVTAGAEESPQLKYPDNDTDSRTCLSSITGSSPVEFPIASPQLSDRNSPDRFVKSMKEDFSGLRKVKSSREMKQKSETKRKKSRSAPEDGKKSSKKKLKNTRSPSPEINASKITEDKGKFADEKHSEEDGSLETPKKLYFNKSHDVETDGEEFKVFNWEALDLESLTSFQEADNEDEKDDPNYNDGDEGVMDGKVASMIETTVPSEVTDTRKQRGDILLLCSEHFIEIFGAATIAQLANGHSRARQSLGVVMPRIKLVDSQLVDLRNVDIEIPKQGAIVVVSLASIEENGIEKNLKRLLDATAAMSYESIEVLICVDRALNDQTNHQIARLQGAVFCHEQLPRVAVAFNYVSLSSLSLKISEIVSTTHPIVEMTDGSSVSLDAILGDQRTTWRLSFLLRTVPSLHVSGAVALLQAAIEENMAESNFETPKKDPSAAAIQFLLANSHKIIDCVRSKPHLFEMIGRVAPIQVMHSVKAILSQATDCEAVS